MKIRGAELVVMALEDEGARFAFGIPGTHNIELYDAMERSGKITPVLVTDEQSASFMADGVSRTSGSIGVANVVPGAGVTHCLSGVAEAFMDNVPLVVLAAGIRSDTGLSYQVHAVDQLAILRPVTKAVLRPGSPAEIHQTVRKAFAIARQGAPGPVAVEIPCDFLMLTHEAPEPARGPMNEAPPKAPDGGAIDRAAALLRGSKNPVIYAGNGARGAAKKLVQLAERLGAPAATTIQGKGVFPESHPLWLWNGLGRSAPAFVRNIASRCDCMLAIGLRFGEVATASYGIAPPENLIHVDIEKDVFNRNFKAKLCVESDSSAFIGALLDKLPGGAARSASLEHEIAEGWFETLETFSRQKASLGRVSPWAFFQALQRLAGPDAIYTADSGNGMFLAMEHLRVGSPGCFNAPVDYSCMGYAVPAAIGARLANPERDVIALEGDGSLLMTGLEALTANSCRAVPLICILRDRELGQIAKFQRRLLDRDTCSILPDYSVEDYADLVGCGYFAIDSDQSAGPVLEKAFAEMRSGKGAVVEVMIDYSEETLFTKGVVMTNFWRYTWGERLRLIARFAGRKLGKR